MADSLVAFTGMDDLVLVLSSLGLGASALAALRKLGGIAHFFHLAARIERLRFPRLREDVRFAEATEADFAEVAEGLGRLDAASRHDVVSRLLFRRRARRGCMIGRDAEGALVSIQWLFRPGDEAARQDWFGARYHPLRPDEVLIENVFVYPRFRGAGVFPTVNHAILEAARREGFTTCTAYIRNDNVASLNAYLELGFRLRRLVTSYTIAGVSWRTP